MGAGSVTFTPQQQEVIDLRGCNVLVSAAAGSGKTAVLTQRIVNMVSDEKEPVDIDRLLVVTFTGAAAAEMRERIGKKLAEKLEQNPESEHIQRQMTLLHNAQITTIDSFCLFLVRNHFQEIGLDPAFRVADEREIKLLGQEVMAQLLEDWFEAGEERFHSCVEALCPKGKEKVLEDHIRNLSRYAASFPWPREWLENRKRDYDTKSVEELKETALWAYLLHYLRGMTGGCIEKLREAAGLIQLPDGPYMYGELIDRELEELELLAEKEDPEELADGIRNFVFGRLPGKKDDTVDPEKKERVKELRECVKKALSDLRDQFFFLSFGGLCEQGRTCALTAEVLIDLVLDYDRRMREKKQEKKIIDFSDMEHYALDILLERRDGQSFPSRVAKQYREFYREILIDEYQDSNLVQEYLLKAVSKEQDGCFNRFMVGDVKQSIYRFRLARPELFLEKYEQYTKSGSQRRIDLSRNFRSRKTVIDTVNRIFENLMQKETGGIDYDEAAALYPGADYPELEGMESELILVGKPEKDQETDAKSAEAMAVACRIRELMQGGRVTDKETGKAVPVRYRDIVILLRSLSGYGEVFQQILGEQGIPAYVTSKSGYFTASEVQMLLNFLRIIDNPLQDIPLYGVLRSVFVGLNEEEIAAVRGQNKNISLYECLSESGNAEIAAFLKQLERYREMAVYLPVRSLILKIVEDYDYLNYVTALPAGTKRRANVEMLLVKASDFEKTSYFGLFHFLRYMEQLEKYDEDYGEADTLDENADVVRIMSIHKSKGLEFPVVILAGMTKKFNLQDVSQAVILDMDLGIGMDFVDQKRRIRRKTLRKNVIAGKLREDMLAEELRLLYVAVTRPKEKLILTAQVQRTEDAETILKRCAAGEREAADSRGLSFLDFIRAGSFFDFLEPVLHRTGLKVRLMTPEQLCGERIEEQIELADALGRLETSACETDAGALECLRERFAFCYPHRALRGLYTKTTVSELKIAAMADQDEAAFHVFENRESESYIPDFRREKEEITGTVRGNAYHRVMEIMDFGRVLGGQFAKIPDRYEEYVALINEEKLESDLKKFLEEQCSEMRLPEEYCRAVRPVRMVRFLKSELGYRMWRAFEEGKLHREQPFVLAIPARRLSGEFPEEEKVLIQGIIDAYFVENQEIVLLDYKTDSVLDMESLWKRYAVQLDYYQEALERLTMLPVKEKKLYSFHLDQY